MQYTTTFLKYSVIVLMIIILVVAFIVAFGLAAIGIFGALAEGVLGYLLLIPIGFLFALIGCVALDGVNYLTDKWEMKA